MKKKLIGIRAALGLCAALGWWGLLYPELALTPDTVVVKSEDEDGRLQELPLEWDFDGNLYRELLNAGPDRLTLRSRLLADLTSLWEAFHYGDK